MKTAKEWVEHHNRADLPREGSYVHALLCEHVEAIQLDAFKAGAEWAARIIHVRELFSAGIPVDSKQVTRGEREILSALLALKEIPK